MATQAVSPGHAPFEPLHEVELDTIPKILFAAVERHDRQDAMRHKEGGAWHTLSHREVLERVTHLAAALDALGVAAGERVAILSENRPEWQIADFAVLSLGAADVPIYATLPAPQIAYILRDAGATTVLVSTAEQLAKIQEIREEVGVRTVIAFDDPRGAPGVRALPEVLAEGKRRVDAGEFSDLRARAHAVGRDDLATLIYTSGTTGNPKGVMLTHFNIASNVAATHLHHVFEMSAGDIGLSFLPLSHSFERMVDYYYWDSGVSIAYVAQMEKVAESLLEVRPHVAAAAPRVFEKIYAKVMGETGFKARIVQWAKGVGEASVEERLGGRQVGPRGLSQTIADRLVFSKLRARTGGRLRAFVSGSAPLSADIAKFFWAAGLPIFEGYGLTETSPVLSANRPGAVKLGSVGLPLPGTEIRIGDQGEILARGPQVMKGYYNSPDATAEVIDEDGWFHTGDVGLVDEDGFIVITDRIKNLIVTAGGKNVAPAPIENAAAMSPFVAQVLMIGDRRPFPALLVVPDFDNLRTWARQEGIDADGAEALAKHPKVQALLERETLGRLDGFARYELPKKVVVIPREFSIDTGELTPTLKIKRRAVEENYRQEILGIYAATRGAE